MTEEAKEAGEGSGQARFVTLFLGAWFGLFIGSMIFRNHVFTWLDPWLAPWPLWVSVLIGWLPLALIMMISVALAATSMQERSRVPAVMVSVLTFVLAVQLGMAVGDPVTAPAAAMRAGFFGAAGPVLIWTAILTVAYWLRNRIAGEKDWYSHPRKLEPVLLLYGGALSTLVGLAVAIAVQP